MKGSTLQCITDDGSVATCDYPGCSGSLAAPPSAELLLRPCWYDVDARDVGAVPVVELARVNEPPRPPRSSFMRAIVMFGWVMFGIGVVFLAIGIFKTTRME